MKKIKLMGTENHETPLPHEEPFLTKIDAAQRQVILDHEENLWAERQLLFIYVV